MTDERLTLDQPLFVLAVPMVKADEIFSSLDKSASAHYPQKAKAI